MGADGHWYLLKRVDWPYEDVLPSEIGISHVFVLGVDALAAYRDTEDRDDMEDGAQQEAETLIRLRFEADMVRTYGANGVYETQYTGVMVLADIERRIAEAEASPTLAHSQRCKEAAKWFLEHAEDHTVWT